MNIILIDCPESLVCPRLPFSWGHESLNIAYASAYIYKDNNVKLFDFCVEKYDSRRFRRFCKTFHPNIIGLSCTSASYISMKTILRDLAEIKKELGILCISGGAQPSSCPEIPLQETEVDMVVKGEGELVLKNIVEALQQGKDPYAVRGIYYLDGERVVMNDPQEYIEDIDTIPYPPRELLPMHKYRSYSDLKRLGSILSSRGCPYSCIYCYHSKGENKKVRYRSPENVYNEMKELKEKYRVHSIHFIDDHFTLNESRVREISQLLVKKPIDVVWECQGRITSSSYELYELMQKAGCVHITFGIESGDEYILNYMNKKQSLKQIEEGIRMAKKSGLKIRGNFIIGFPVETHDSIMRTILFAKKLQLDRTSFFLLTPYPHSILWDYAVKEGIINIENMNWEIFTQYEPFFSSQELSKDMLVDYLDIANITTSRNLSQLLFYFFMSKHRKKFIATCYKTFHKNILSYSQK